MRSSSRRTHRARSIGTTETYRTPLCYIGFEQGLAGRDVVQCRAEGVTMPRQMTTAEAIAALGLSRRTIQRRVKDGTLATTFVAGHRLIIVPDEVLGEPKRSTAEPRHEIVADAPAVPLAQFDALRAELDAVKSERD